MVQRDAQLQPSGRRVGIGVRGLGGRTGGCAACGYRVCRHTPGGRGRSRYSEGRWPRGISLEVVPQASAISVED